MKQISSLLLVFVSLFTYSQVNDPVSPSWRMENHRQFDFWIGEWDVNLRIQQETGEWKDQVQSTGRVYRILDGKAILELWNENKFNEGIKGYSLRYFNEEKNKWVLWLNWPGKNRSGSNSLEGSFRHGRGEFFSEFPKNDSVTITQRYTFCDITPTSLRWDDAYSEDGGKSWKQGSWIMEFSRKLDIAPEFTQNEPIHTYDEGTRCDLAQFDYFDSWVGSWSGKVKAQGSRGSSATLEIFPALDGCAILVFMSYEEDGQLIKTFSLSTYNTYANTYEEGTLDNRPGSTFDIKYGGLSNEVLTLLNKEKTTKSVWEKSSSGLKWEQHSLVDGEYQLIKTINFKQ